MILAASYGLTYAVYQSHAVPLATSGVCAAASVKSTSVVLLGPCRQIPKESRNFLFLELFLFPWHIITATSDCSQTNLAHPFCAQRRGRSQQHGHSRRPCSRLLRASLLSPNLHLGWLLKKANHCPKLSAYFQGPGRLLNSGPLSCRPFLRVVLRMAAQFACGMYVDLQSTQQNARNHGPYTHYFG